MNSYLYDAQGRVLQVFVDGQGVPRRIPDLLFCNSTEHYAPETCYVLDGVVLPLSPQPTPHHTFDYTTKQWIDPRTAETEWPLVRVKRDGLLSKSDWTQLPDVPITTKEAWAAYRQALRDITIQADPFKIEWPMPPNI